MRRTHPTERGAALITTLVAIAIVGVLMAAVGNLVIGHYGRSQTDQNAAKALNYAEAALNFQVQKIGANLGRTQHKLDNLASNIADATYGVNPGNDSTGTWYPVGTRPPMSNYLPGSDYVRAWVWPSPLNIYNNDLLNPQYIYGEAQINGVRRTVRAKAGAEGIFDTYALFGINRVQMGGTSVSVSTAIGTNGLITSQDPDLTNNVGPTGLTTQDVVLAGSGAQNGTAPNNTLSQPTPTRQGTAEPFPTIFELANDVATGIRDRVGVSGAVAGVTYPTYATQAGFLNTRGVRNFYDRATGTNYNDNNWATYLDRNNVATAFPISGLIPSGNALTLVGKTWGSNYYMQGINVQGTLSVNLNEGPVNLWIDSTATNGDTLAGNFTVTGPAANQFRIYYRNPNPNGTLTLTGGGNTPTNVIAFIYVYDRKVYTSTFSPPADPASLGDQFGSFNINGNVAITGSVIAWDTGSISGNVSITLPTNPGVSPGEGLLFYGLVQPWSEIQPVRGNTP